MGDDELVGLTEAAAELESSREWLRKLIHRGEVRFVKVGRSYGIPRSEIRRLKQTPKRHGGWPKGKPRKVSDFRYPLAGDIATHKLCAEH